MVDGNKVLATGSIDSSTVSTAIGIGLVVLFGYWSLKVIGPFLPVALWSAILAVALYPLFSWLARQLGNRQLAAILVTLLCLAIVIGPLTWIGLGLIDGVDFALRAFQSNAFSIPLPAESVKGWPLIGEQVHRLLTLAATDTKAVLLEAAPRLRPLGGKLIDIGESVVFGLLEFFASIVIAGFLFSGGPQLINSLGAFLHRILGDRTEEMIQLAGNTIRNVSRGVVGIALVQSFLVGVGFVVAGVPAAGLFTFSCLVLGIVQIGPAILLIPIVVWSWMTMEATKALMFSVYMIPVGLVDNVFRPFVMARGLTTPMPVILIGVVGGTIAYGISGLFLGPIVLSVAWALIAAWVRDGGPGGSWAQPERL
jgi:predicted PurR-regulated permease PerM